MPVWHSNCSTWDIVTFKPCWADLPPGSKQAFPWNQPRHSAGASNNESSEREPGPSLPSAEGSPWLVAFPRDFWYTCAYQAKAVLFVLTRHKPG